MRAALCFGLALAVCLVFAPRAGADDGAAVAPAPTSQESLVAARSPAVVSVRLTLQIAFTFGGTVREQEFNQTTTGVIVHPRGLIMLPSEIFTPNLRRRDADVKVTPSSIRVVFPGDPKEYPAILGAKDSKLGLAFVLIRDLEGREIASLNLSKRAAPKVGDTLWGVTRLSEDFDHAPVCSEVAVIASITRPRACWAVDDANRFRAEPLYTKDGAVAGVVAQQEGVGEDADTQICLLPLNLVETTIERSMKMAERALEDVLAAEAEAKASGEEPKDEGADEKPDDKPETEPDGEGSGE